jgi:hypothetical protein
MKDLLNRIDGLSRGRKFAIYLLLLLNVLTWLAVCIILASYLVP